MVIMQLGELVKNNNAFFSHIFQGIAYYNIYNHKDEVYYQIPVAVEEMGDTEYSEVERSIVFIKWIRKAMADGTLRKVIPD